MSREAQLRKTIVKYLRRIDTKGWVSNHDGNMSLRLPNGRFLCTPTAMAKYEISENDLLVVDTDGRVIRGHRRLFSEWILHRAVFTQRPEVDAVIHTHAPTATAFGVAQMPLPHPFLPEAVVSLGPVVPSVRRTMPGKDAADALQEVLGDCQVCLLEGNGLLSWGIDAEQAFLRMELVEHLCQIATESIALGGVKVLDAEMIESLTKKHIAAGLAAPNLQLNTSQDATAQLSAQVQRHLMDQVVGMHSGRLSAVVAEVTKLTLAELQQEK